MYRVEDLIGPVFSAFGFPHFLGEYSIRIVRERLPSQRAEALHLTLVWLETAEQGVGITFGAVEYVRGCGHILRYILFIDSRVVFHSPPDTINIGFSSYCCYCCSPISIIIVISVTKLRAFIYYYIINLILISFGARESVNRWLAVPLHWAIFFQTTLHTLHEAWRKWWINSHVAGQMLGGFSSAEWTART